MVHGGWWDGPDAEDCDPGDAARLLHVVFEGGYPHLVQPAPPEDAADPRYDAIILGAMRDDYLGVTSEFLADELARIGHAGVTVTGEPEPILACPCCGYRTFERWEECDVCRSCGWEDDGNRDPQQYSSVNHQTLGEGRRNFVEFGTSCPQSQGKVDRQPRK